MAHSMAWRTTRLMSRIIGQLALPEMFEYLELVEGPDIAESHKEQCPNFTLKFVKDIQAVTSGFKNNPFTEEQFKPINSTGLVFPEAIVNDVESERFTFTKVIRIITISCLSVAPMAKK